MKRIYIICIYILHGTEHGHVRAASKWEWNVLVLNVWINIEYAIVCIDVRTYVVHANKTREFA